MLALDVAASAPSPRKRPTQMALMVPFSDWRIEEASVGSANASRVLAIGPCVRSPRPVCAVLLRLPCVSLLYPGEGRGPGRCEAAVPAALDPGLRRETA